MDSDRVIADFVGYVREESGIQLDEYDLELTFPASFAHLRLDGVDLCQAEVDLEDAGPSDVAMALLEALGDVRSALGARKLRQVRSALPAIVKLVRTRLRDAGTAGEIVEGLSFKVEEGMEDGGAYAWADADAATGYPPLRLAITGPGALALTHPILSRCSDTPVNVDGYSLRPVTLRTRQGPWPGV